MNLSAHDDCEDASASETDADHSVTYIKRIRDLDVTVGIISAYVSNNSLRPSELPTLIAEVHAVVSGSSNATVIEPNVSVEPARPAAVRRSITPNALISFIDGKPYKTLKRHLGTYGLDFDAYRAQYGLPADYPTVSANYSATRSALAKDLGLGKKVGRKSEE